MKRLVGVVAGLAVLVAGVGSANGTAVAGGRAASSTVSWGPCPATDGREAPDDLECATVRVPLDYREPMGHQIEIAINRVRARVSRDANHLGTLLLNPGGPGASGRELTRYVATSLPADVSARYDIVGFDPRGVGASEPAVRCVDPEVYYRAPRVDAVPRNAAQERILLDRARQYATQCGNHWSWLLPYMTTENSARDMDRIRAALGEAQISYLGYSYGTYLGAVYATLFPQRVKRLVMDSSVDPTAVWYDSNLRQNLAFERRHRQFLAWVARNNSVYRLGRTQEETSFAYYALRDRLRTRPAGGVVGPSELDDTFTFAGYTDKVWPEFARAWSSYVRHGDVDGLVAAFNKHGRTDAKEENGYAVYLSVQCRDARWPRDWATWRTDMTRMHREAPFMTWPNAWYNAPCAFWPARGGTPVEVKASPKLPPFLILQSRHDAATPYRGALTMAEQFPRARMVLDAGGNHGVSLSGNRCVDRHLAAYLRDGSLPQRSARCAASPTPQADPQHGAHRSAERHRAATAPTGPTGPTAPATPDALGIVGVVGPLIGR
ncbi:alpha/beta hydrolase fold [Nonomuraea maritima]|uniref:Alpha/beta hydrolase fold n=1 Tax=Nonomuraea maritima TaxID=683260 RepID=A0A1G8TIB9_9ACTN|nr:alpha/beta hydrolase [Nonomuraea maritima]SDJ40420.1 alpha/beta hydrolase fold [Nonomuraea maritima]